jgi:hypothetical protein
MRDEWRLSGEACARGSDLEAVWRLEQLQDRMRAARKLTAGR